MSNLVMILTHRRRSCFLCQQMSLIFKWSRETGTLYRTSEWCMLWSWERASVIEEVRAWRDLFLTYHVLGANYE